MANTSNPVSQFAVGDIVKLNAGGPDMSVLRVKKHHTSKEFSGFYDCQWFAGKKLEHGEFKEESLVLVKKQGE